MIRTETQSKTPAVLRYSLSWLLVAIMAVFALLAASCGDDDSSDDNGSTATVQETPESDDDGDTSGSTEPAEPTSEMESEDEPATTDTMAPSEPIRIAVVAPSARNDLAFTQSMADALDVIAESYDVDINITDGTFIVEDAATAIRGYAEDGYDLVIAHGSQYGGPLQEIAPDFSETSFAWGTTVDTFGLDNVYAYTTRSDQGAYVMGAMAAALSESGVIGVVGPIEVGDAKLYVDGFKAGAENQDPDVTVNVNYIESFSDVALAAEAAEAHLSLGADILTGTAQMVVGATGVARENDVAWFGTQANQTSLGESNVVASQVYHWEVLLREMLDSIANGKLGGESFSIDIANGGLTIEFNDGYALPAEVRSLADDIVAGFRDGSISTGVE